MVVSMTLMKYPFENLVKKSENTDKQHFLLFPQGFPRYHIKGKFGHSDHHILSNNKIMSSANSFKFPFGKE